MTQLKLFFDTETTGVPKNYNAPISDVDNYPRLVQLGYIVVGDGKKLLEQEFIIKPEGFEIPVEASNVHGITTEIAFEKGFHIKDVLNDFAYWVNQSQVLIGHNVKFDINVVGAEFWRLYKDSPLERKESVCTMLSGIEFCGLPGRYPGKLKYPKLEELYFALFNKPLDQSHTALDDITHTIECYDAMIQKGIIR